MYAAKDIREMATLFRYSSDVSPENAFGMQMVADLLAKLDNISNVDIEQEIEKAFGARHNNYTVS
jgi:hypothetical protein